MYIGFFLFLLVSFADSFDMCRSLLQISFYFCLSLLMYTGLVCRAGHLATKVARNAYNVVSIQVSFVSLF